MAKKSSMEFDFKSVDIEKLTNEGDILVKEFEKLLEKIGPKHQKKKFLWSKIFINALNERRNALIMFNNLYMEVHGSQEMHSIHSQNLVKYLERQSKANDQLLKLSELMNEALTDEDVMEDGMDENDMYEHLQNLNKGK